MTLLHWRDADRADREPLKAFSCTDPRPSGSLLSRRPPEHPKPWELEVQSRIRNLLKPPAGRGQLILLGEDAQGIAAVAWTQEDAGPDDVFVKLAAVATRCRNCQGRYADEMASVLRQRLRDRADAAGHASVWLTAKVEQRNSASKRLLQRLRASYVCDDGDYELWDTTLEQVR